MTPFLKTPNILRTAVLFCLSVQFLPQFPRRKMNRDRQFPPCCLGVTTTEPGFAPNPFQSPDENAIYCNRRPQLSPPHPAEHSFLLQRTKSFAFKQIQNLCETPVPAQPSTNFVLCLRLSALCFHGLTNCFSRKPFVFRIICVAPGVWGCYGTSSNLGRLWRRSRGPASARSCNKSFSGPRPALQIRKCARTRGAGGNTRNIHRAFPARENTICIRSLRRCLCPSARDPGISPGNRAPNTVAGPTLRAPRRYPRTYSEECRTIFRAAADHCRETRDARR